MMNQEFNLEDFLETMNQMKNLGPIDKLVEMIPGFNTKELKGVRFCINEKEHG